MPAGDSLYYLRNHEIDRSLWDACIDNAGNGLIYAKSYYLDAITKNWDAVVCGDYKAVLPLPWNKKYFFAYVYPPPFLQQLGVFSERPLPADRLSEMIWLAEKNFKFGEYFLNYRNPFQNTIPKNNFILPLNQEYPNLSKNYKKDLVKNLKKAGKLQLQYRAGNDFKKAVHLYQQTYGNRIPYVKRGDYIRLIAACKSVAERNELIVREIRDSYTGNLLSILVCLKDKKRIYVLLSTTTPSGRKSEANHFLIDHLIREFAGQNLILDFEGSDLPGIAHFYMNFGSINQPYFFYRWNNLPWPMKRLKGN